MFENPPDVVTESVQTVLSTVPPENQELLPMSNTESVESVSITTNLAKDVRIF